MIKLITKKKGKWKKIITTQGIQEAIKDLNKEKGPGRNGINNEFYVHFKQGFCPILEAVTKNIHSSKEMPKEILKSYICLLSKDPSEEKKYKEILSLLNSDYKIISKTN